MRGPPTRVDKKPEEAMTDTVPAPDPRYVQLAGELGPLLEAEAPAIEAARELTEPVLSALLGRDFFRLLVPRDLGGAEVSPLTLMAVIETIAGKDASTAWCVGQNAVSAMLSAYLEPESAREVFGSPSGVIAWGPPSKGEARVVEGGYALSGTFNFASGSRHATWLGAHVPVIERDGRVRAEADGTRITHTVAFPKREARIIDNWHVMGLKGTGSDSYTVDGLFIPVRFTVSRGSSSRPRNIGTLYRFGPSSLYAASFASVALGIARSTLDAFVSIARDKVPRGAKRVLRDNNFVQYQVGLAEAGLRAARAFLTDAYQRAWQHAAAGADLGPDQNVGLRLATTWSIREATSVVEAIYDAAGGTAVFSANPFERRFRDIHMVTQQIQGHRANFESAGQVLLGAEPDRRMFTF
jgi:alkylation response protein AidB-like acyl-CoA dehydrogenase